MKKYEKMRASISHSFKNEIENLKFEIIRLNKENADLQVENATLKNDIRKYKNRLESMSDVKKGIFGLTESIKNLI